MSLPNLSGLNRDSKLSTAAVGAITRAAPPETCSICLEPLYGCDGQSEHASQRRRVGGDGEETPPLVWPACPPDQWYAPRSVAVLNGCGHFMHKQCIAGFVRTQMQRGQEPRCPLCNAPITSDESDELMEIVSGPTTAHIDDYPTEEGWSRFYEGPQGRRHLVMRMRDRLLMYYEGPKGAERLVRVDFPNDNVKHYEGPMGAERLMRMDFPSGRVQHYEGPKGAERLVRADFPNDNVQHYEGPKGAERLVRVTYPSGLVQHYEGPKGAVRRVRAVFSNNTVQDYEGPRGAERLVQVTYPSGRVVKVKSGPP